MLPLSKVLEEMVFLFGLEENFEAIACNYMLIENGSFSAQLLDAASKVLPLVVTVSGRVGSDTPINCEYSGLRGVIVEQTVLQLT